MSIESIKVIAQKAKAKELTYKSLINDGFNVEHINVLINKYKLDIPPLYKSHKFYTCNTGDYFLFKDVYKEEKHPVLRIVKNPINNTIIVQYMEQNLLAPGYRYFKEIEDKERINELKESIKEWICKLNL